MNTNRTILRTALVVMAAGSLMALGGNALASAADSVRVNFADLDLETTAGAKALYERIETASRNVCGIGSRIDSGTLKEQRDAKRCFRQSMKEALQAVGHDALARLPADERSAASRVIA